MQPTLSELQQIIVAWHVELWSISPLSNAPKICDLIIAILGIILPMNMMDGRRKLTHSGTVNLSSL